MKNLLAGAMLVVLSVSNAIAAELSTKIAAQYVGNNGSVVVNHAVQQINLFIPLLGGFYADTWGSLAIEGDEREIDWTVVWAGEILAVNLNIGVSYFDFDKPFFSKGDVINPYIEVNKTVKLQESQLLTSSLKIETPALVDSGSVAGTFTHIGVKHAWQVMETLSITQNVKILYDNGAYGMDDGFVGKYNASLAVAVTKSVALNASVDITKPLDSINDRGMEVIPSIGMEIKF